METEEVKSGVIGNPGDGRALPPKRWRGAPRLATAESLPPFGKRDPRRGGAARGPQWRKDVVGEPSICWSHRGDPATIEVPGDKE